MSNIVLSKTHLIAVFVLSVFSTILMSSSEAYAACSPGIPCTDYDIYSDPTSGTAGGFNGPKVDDATAPHDETACDGNFMNQIYARAYMEASREVIMGQQLIHKPDSVLEYTCFDEYLNQAAENANSFSSSSDFASRNICIETADSGCINTTITTPVSGTEVADALGIFLYGTLQQYVNTNFGHTFMGEATTIDSSISAPAATPYNCSHMATVWEIAKCVDFAEDDRFRTFEELITADPRSIPAACSPSAIASDAIEAASDPTKLDNTSSALPNLTPASLADNVTDPCPAPGTPATGVNTGFSNDLVRVANNCDISNSERNAYSVLDLMESYDELFRGASNMEVSIPLSNYIPGTGTATGIVVCRLPIPTGVPIISYDYNAPGDASNFSGPGTGPGGMHEVDRTTFLHYDFICPNPGCFYQAARVPYIEGLPLPASVPTGICVPY